MIRCFCFFHGGELMTLAEYLGIHA